MIDLSLARFAAVGVANTLLGYGVIVLLHHGFGASPLLANVGGYAVGGLSSYLLNRRYTFASSRPHAEALPRFALTAGGCFALNLVVLAFCLSVLALPVALAQAFAVGSYTLAFYLASRLLVFRR